MAWNLDVGMAPCRADRSFLPGPMISQTIVPRIRPVALIGLAALAACSDPSTVDLAVAEGGTVTLPVRVHILSSQRFPQLDARIDEDEVSALVVEANQVWAAAEIRWDVTEVLFEEAVETDGFQQMLEQVAQGQDVDADVLRGVLPRENRVPGEWDAFFIHDLGESPVAGVYFGAGLLVVKVASQFESPNLALTGRVLAHELGHSLSLPHVPCVSRGNLMAVGCLGEDRRRLEGSQIAAARRQSVRRVPY